MSDRTGSAGVERRGVVDRIVDGWAVVLLEEPDEEVRLPSEQLPAGVGEGTVVVLRASWEVVGHDDDTATDARREEMARRLERLRRERGGRFDDDDLGDTGHPVV